MRSILLSLVTILFVGGMLTGATHAVFSAQDTLPNNSVGSANLSLGLSHSAGKPLAVSNLLPGETRGWEYVDVKNNSGVPLNYFFYLDTATTLSDWNLWNVLKIEVRVTPDLQSVPSVACENANATYVYQPGYVGGVYGVDKKQTVQTNVADQATVRICQRISLDSSVGNEAQGRTHTFTEVFVGEQYIAPNPG